MATGSADQTVRCWDAATGRELEELSAHRAAVAGVAIMPDQQTILSAGADGSLRQWKPAAVRVLAGHEGPIQAIAAHPNGSVIFTASADHTVKAFDINSGAVLRTLTGHTGGVRSVVVTDDGAEVISGGDDKTVRAWNVADGKLAAAVTALPAPVLSLAARSPGSRRLDWPTVRSRSSISLPRTPRPSSGNRLPRGQVRFRRSASRPIDRHCSPAATRRLCISGTSASRANQGCLPDTLHRFTLPPGRLDGKQITTGAADKTLRQWDSSKAAQVRQWNAHANVVYAVAYSPRGDVLASGGDDKLIKYWNPADGKELRQSVGHGAPVYCLSFTPDGSRLASGSVDKTIRIWNVADGKELAKLDGHPDDVYAVAYQPRRQTAGLGRVWRPRVRLGSRDRQGRSGTTSSRRAS